MHSCSDSEVQIEKEPVLRRQASSQIDTGVPFQAWYRFFRTVKFSIGISTELSQVNWKYMATTAARKTSATRSRRTRKWSASVMQKSDALDLEPRIFRSDSAGKIARSLKQSAERSKRRKGTPFQSAMSMLNFYINRGGKNLSIRKKRTLEKAKGELRQLFGRPKKAENQ
jgi:hypothetical protein